MPPAKTVYYARLVLIIAKCGTLLTKKLFEKRVKKLAPNDTIAAFLKNNEKEINKTKTESHYKRLLFPTHGEINIHKWDLSLFCFLLQLKMCKLEQINKSDILKLKDMRNDIYHLPEPAITESGLHSRLADIQAVFERTYILIDDKLFEEELNQMVEELKVDSNLVEEFVKKDRIMVEREICWFELLAEKQETILIKVDECRAHGLQHSERLDVLEKKIDGIIKHLPPETPVRQGGRIKIELQNCTTELNDKISNILEILFNDIIAGENSNPSEEFSEKDIETLTKAVRTVHDEFRERNIRMLRVEVSCLLLRIECVTLSSCIEFIRSYRDGSILNQFQDLLTAVRSVEGCANVEFHIVSSEDEIIDMMDDLATTLESIVHRTGKNSLVDSGEILTEQVNNVTPSKEQEVVNEEQNQDLGHYMEDEPSSQTNYNSNSDLHKPKDKQETLSSTEKSQVKEKRLDADSLFANQKTTHSSSESDSSEESEDDDKPDQFGGASCIKLNKKEITELQNLGLHSNDGSNQTDTCTKESVSSDTCTHNKNEKMPLDFKKKSGDSNANESTDENNDDDSSGYVKDHSNYVKALKDDSSLTTINHRSDERTSQTAKNNKKPPAKESSSKENKNKNPGKFRRKKQSSNKSDRNNDSDDDSPGAGGVAQRTNHSGDSEAGENNNKESQEPIAEVASIRQNDSRVNSLYDSSRLCSLPDNRSRDTPTTASSSKEENDFDQTGQRQRHDSGYDGTFDDANESHSRSDKSDESRRLQLSTFNMKQVEEQLKEESKKLQQAKEQLKEESKKLQQAKEQLKEESKKLQQAKEQRKLFEKENEDLTKKLHERKEKLKKMETERKKSDLDTEITTTETSLKDLNKEIYEQLEKLKKMETKRKKSDLDTKVTTTETSLKVKDETSSILKMVKTLGIDNVPKNITELYRFLQKLLRLLRGMQGIDNTFCMDVLFDVFKLLRGMHGKSKYQTFCKVVLLNALTLLYEMHDKGKDQKFHKDVLLDVLSSLLNGGHDKGKYQMFGEDEDLDAVDEEISSGYSKRKPFLGLSHLAVWSAENELNEYDKSLGTNRMPEHDEEKNTYQRISGNYKYNSKTEYSIFDKDELGFYKDYDTERRRQKQ